MFNLFNRIKEIVVGKNKNKNKNKAKPVVVNVKSNKPSVEIEELKETTKNRPMKLRFSPTAWAKFLFMRDIGDTEVGGFAITMPDDLLYIDDFILPKQECGWASVDFDNESVADITDDLIDEGFKPAQFLRIWIHTHPSMSASPSKTDEDTFEKAFGGCDWAIMAIVSTNGDHYCRLQINGGPLPGSFEIPIEVDYESYDFPASDSEGWQKEYDAKVEKVTYAYSGGYGGRGGYGGYYDWRSQHGYEGHTIGEGCGSQAGFRPPEEKEGQDDTELSVISGWDQSDFDIVPVKVPLSIPDEILQRLTPQQLLHLEDMSPYEREYVLDELKEKLNLGD